MRICSVNGDRVSGWMTWPLWAVLCENPSIAAKAAAHVLLQLSTWEQLPRARGCW